MQFKFSLRVFVICGILTALMLWASYWQYTRYIEKLAYIKELDRRLEAPVEALNSLAAKNNPTADIIYKRVSLKGTWDYEHEIILRNRKLGDIAGVHVLTPLLIDGNIANRVLVSRGFLPLSLSNPEKRKKFRNAPTETFLALIKESNQPKLFAPEDAEVGPGRPWLDAWLRVNLADISKQLPYPIEPYYLEMMSRDSKELDSNKLLQQKSERDQMLFLPGAGASLGSIEDDQKEINYPVPVFDTIVPAGRHYSYIFEWAIMAVMVIIAGLILQLRRDVNVPSISNLSST